VKSKWNDGNINSSIFGAVLFLLIAFFGVAYVKWLPYFAKSFVAESKHNIGISILSGQAAYVPPISLKAAFEYAVAYGKSIWQALLLGLLLGSGIKTLIPGRWLSNTLGHLGLRNVVLGGLFAIPCMMCTCCAAPIAIGMRQRKASVGSVVSWWISNPVLNPATLVFMGFVLGWKWSLFRLVTGMLMVIVVACLAERYALPAERKIEEVDLHSSEISHDSLLERWWSEFKTLALGLVPEYIILVLLLGATRAWLFPVLGAHDSFFWVIAMAVAGTLFVIPTAGEVPILQGMFALGLGNGPAAALLMTLPAVSLPSLVMLGRIFSLRTRLVIAGGVVAVGIIAGFLATGLF